MANLKEELSFGKAHPYHLVVEQLQNFAEELGLLDGDQVEERDGRTRLEWRNEDPGIEVAMEELGLGGVVEVENL